MLPSHSLQPKRKLPYFYITEQVRLMAKKFLITRGQFFFGFFQFLLFQFCGISLSDHNNPNCQILGSFRRFRYVNSTKQSWWSSCNPSGGILIYSSNSSEALASVKFFAISPAPTHFQIFSLFNSLINGGNLICIEESVLQAKKKPKW